MNRRNYLSLAGGAAVATTLAGCTGAESTDVAAEGESATAAATGTPTPTVRPTRTPAPDPTATPTVRPTSIAAGSTFGPFTYQHSGPGTTEELDLVQAPLTASYSYSGSSNFQVQLVSMDGTAADDHLLANEIGSVEGATVVPVRTAGPYVLDVEADGDWAIRLEQQTDPQTHDLPVQAQGTGSWAYGPYTFDGAIRFTATHTGTENFIVEAVPVSMVAFGDLIFNEIGGVDASTTARINGLAYIDVTADGAWTLSGG